MKGDLALLEQALIQFAIKELTKKGYTLVAPPLMMKREYYKGVTAMGDFQEMLYKAAESKEAEGSKAIEHIDEELFMIATSEHPISNGFSKKDLPKKYINAGCNQRVPAGHATKAGDGEKRAIPLLPLPFGANRVTGFFGRTRIMIGGRLIQPFWGCSIRMLNRTTSKSHFLLPPPALPHRIAITQMFWPMATPTVPSLALVI